LIPEQLSDPLQELPVAACGKLPYTGTVNVSGDHDMAVAQRLDARITLEEKELLQEAAAAKGLTLTAFVTSSAREAALKVLKEQHVIELGKRDQQAFAEALLNPEPPNERLRTLAKAPRFGSR
jgi:uncharacterized protein (DUF1778 family)